jgi:prolipoprotein diacylglyceryltransferase
MFPIILSIGNFHLYTSSLVISIGFLVSLFIFWKKTRVEIVEEEKIFDFILIFIIFSLVFGRLVYVFEHANDFQFWIDRIIHIYKYPGFNIWGLCFGGVLGSFLYFKKIMKTNSIFLFDAISLSLSIFLGFMFLGFFFDGLYAGSNSIFGIYFVGHVGKRIPLQIFASLLFFIYYFLLRNVNLKKAKGFVFWLFCSYFFGILLALEFLRRDRIYFEGIVINIFTYFLVSLFSGIIFIIKYKSVIFKKLSFIKFKLFKK